jgi:ABC-2 type transport system ATP-binding protein
METLAIETVDLGKVYSNGTVALNNVSLMIPRGSIFSFLGPNGAGKTTTVRVLSCVLKPTTGSATVLGWDVEGNDRVKTTIRRQIGVLTENHGLYERLTVEQNLRFFGSFYGLEQDQLDANIKMLLEDFKLTERLYEKVGTLSKGLKQRAALVKTLLHDPEIVFLDEPTAGLDPKASVEFREYIEYLGKKREKTIFMCTHNLAEAQALSDQVAIIDKGAIKKIGPPSELEKEMFTGVNYKIVSTQDFPESIQAMVRDSFGLEPSTNGKELQVPIKPDAETEIIPELVRAVVDAGVPVLQVVKAGHSLEDVYLKLMEGEEVPRVEKQQKKRRGFVHFG